MTELKIKVGREELTISPPEYFLDNGSCVQLVTPYDTHRKKTDRWSYTNHKISKKEWKRLKKEYQFKVRTKKEENFTYYEYHL